MARIAIDARELLGQPTGTGRYLGQILAAWAGLPGIDAHEFVVCAPGRVGIPAALRATMSIAPGGGTLWEQRVLPRLVAGAGADVLFAPAYSAPLRCPVPTVVTMHDVSFAAHPEWFRWREGLRRRVLARLSARRAARVVTVSEFSKREIVRHLRVAPERVEVIYSGATMLTGAARAPGGSPEPLILYVGTVFNRRHVPALIEGFSRLATRVPDARLEIVGGNRTTPFIDVEAAAARAGGRVHVRAYANDTELAELYGTAAAFAFLSEYEGFGFTPIEALSAGVPIVVLDTEVAREIYGPAAIYVERPEPALIEAALERALTDARERTRVLDAAPEVLARYSWPRCAERTLQVLVESATLNHRGRL